MTYDLGDPAMTWSIRVQDELVSQIWAMALSISQKLPRSYKTVFKSVDADQWKEACERVIGMLTSMDVWEEVVLPARKRAILSKWVFAKKQNSSGQVTKYNA